MKFLGALSSLLSVAAGFAVQSPAQLYIRDIVEERSSSNAFYGKNLRILPLGGKTRTMLSHDMC